MDVLSGDRTAQTLAKALDGLALRSRTIAHNVANVDTPNFRSLEVSFEEDLQAALARPAAARPAPASLAATDARHLAAAPAGTAGALGDVAAVTPRVAELSTSTLRRDGNNVDIDHEMSSLAETQLAFGAVTQLMNLRFQHLRQAIWEGRR